MPKFFPLTKIRHTLRRLKIGRTIFCTSRGWRLMLLCLLIGLGLLNLITLSSASTRGYQLKNLEKRIAELKKENQKINLEISSLSSPKFLEESAVNLGMVKAKEIKYLSPTTGVLVVR